MRKRNLVWLVLLLPLVLNLGCKPPVIHFYLLNSGKEPAEIILEFAKPINPEFLKLRFVNRVIRVLPRSYSGMSRHLEFEMIAENRAKFILPPRSTVYLGPEHYQIVQVHIKVYNWSRTYTTRDFDEWKQGWKDSMVIPIFLDVAEEVRLRNLE